MSDGGDGFGEVLSGLLDAQPHVVETVDAAHRPINAQWTLNLTKHLAIVESARVVGLAMRGGDSKGDQFQDNGKPGLPGIVFFRGINGYRWNNWRIQFSGGVDDGPDCRQIHCGTFGSQVKSPAGAGLLSITRKKVLISNSQD